MHPKFSVTSGEAAHPFSPNSELQGGISRVPDAYRVERERDVLMTAPELSERCRELEEHWFPGLLQANDWNIDSFVNEIRHGPKIRSPSRRETALIGAWEHFR